MVPLKRSKESGGVSFWGTKEPHTLRKVPWNFHWLLQESLEVYEIFRDSLFFLKLTWYQWRSLTCQSNLEFMQIPPLPVLCKMVNGNVFILIFLSRNLVCNVEHLPPFPSTLTFIKICSWEEEVKKKPRTQSKVWPINFKNKGNSFLGD
jgi:hypothetical protein